MKIDTSCRYRCRIGSVATVGEPLESCVTGCYWVFLWIFYMAVELGK